MSYQVDHADWCYWVTHRSCCGQPGDRIEDECDCGAAETQGVIDRLEARLAAIKKVISGYGLMPPSGYQATRFMEDLDRALHGELA